MPGPSDSSPLSMAPGIAAHNPRRLLRSALGNSDSASDASDRFSPPQTSPEVPLATARANLDATAKRKATQPLDPGSPIKRAKQESETPSDIELPKKRIVPFPEKPAVIEERNGEIEFRVVNNDGRRDSTIILTGLKCIFQKQLPKMPKDYIARLVYDRTHMSIAIVKKPLEVVG